MRRTTLRVHRVPQCGALRSAFIVVQRLAAEWIRRQASKETLRCVRRREVLDQFALRALVSLSPRMLPYFRLLTVFFAVVFFARRAGFFFRGRLAPFPAFIVFGRAWRGW
jgi:hypothetical protein